MKQNDLLTNFFKSRKSFSFVEDYLLGNKKAIEAHTLTQLRNWGSPKTQKILNELDKDELDALIGDISFWIWEKGRIRGYRTGVELTTALIGHDPVLNGSRMVEEFMEKLEI